MTTNTALQEKTPLSGLPVLVGAAGWSTGAALAAVLVALLVDGGDAALGAAAGGLATVLVLGLGTWIVLKVSQVAPVAALLAALGVFTAQGVLLVVTLAVVSALTDGPQVNAAAFSVIAVTVVWTTMFAVLVRREKLPIFDLSAMAPGGDPVQPSTADGAGAE